MQEGEASEIWFLIGSQELYGQETLAMVAQQGREVVQALNEAASISVDVKFQAVLKSSEDVLQCMHAANSAPECIGVMVWMHTFSPAKMWIVGLQVLQKPIAHFHTQYHQAIPWDTIDMDFMNLNQSAHGDREFGHLTARMSKYPKVIVGHWQDEQVCAEIGRWCRLTVGWAASKNMKVARIGDNMRDVAVTEGNKVSAQIRFGYQVNGFGVGDLVEHVKAASDAAVKETIDVYEASYHVDKNLNKEGLKHRSLKEAARIEVGLRSFLEEGRFSAFTTTFENLHGLHQLPGIAVQRLMGDGYGFGAEGDWKTAALVRTMKAISKGLSGGNTFMEDYTYHFSAAGDLVLGSHMLEICPSVAHGNITCEVHPLSIGGKNDPVRLVFRGKSGPAINVSLIDLGHRFRMVVNAVEAHDIPQDMPNLPVARLLWKPLPSLRDSAKCWITAGGAHHTCFSQSLTCADMEDFADLAGIECIVIDKNTTYRQLRQELRTNAVFFD
ncbi:MAG: L-arabinose isomerase [Saprospiraceae bacterium]|nr:L-arabinose isomerase [Saprospiraceae bacterium]